MSVKKKANGTGKKKKISQKTPAISVIIPTYKEEHTIVKTIKQLVKHAKGIDYEIVIADASPDKNTLLAIRATGLDKFLGDRLKMIIAPKGRAQQMNYGANYSHGNVLLFLHSDSLVPKHWNDLILSGEAFDYGCFYKQFDRDSFWLRLNAKYGNTRSKLYGYLMGDHGIFCTRGAFIEVGGYPVKEIFEDIEFSLLLKGRKRKVVVIPLITSARRFEGKWFLKIWFIYQLLKILYRLGASEKTLIRVYKWQ